MSLKKVFYAFAIFLIAFSLSSSFAANRIKLTGTFSSLEFNEEGGDLLGLEIRIVVTRKGYYATVQFSIGEPDVPVLAVVNWIDRKSGRFVIEIPEPNMSAGKIEGRVKDNELEGVFIGVRGGVPSEIKLSRKSSYWD